MIPIIFIIATRCNSVGIGETHVQCNIMYLLCHDDNTASKGSRVNGKKIREKTYLK